MRFLFTLPLLFVSVNQIFAQCNVQTNERDDGVTIRYIRPDRVGLCDRFVLGLSMQTNGQQFYVMALTIFETTAARLQDKLIFILHK